MKKIVRLLRVIVLRVLVTLKTDLFGRNDRNETKKCRVKLAKKKREHVELWERKKDFDWM